MSVEKLQAMMNSAYNRWRCGMKYREFLMELSGPERCCVVIGNLNYQVENGGFMQWYDNDYHEGADFLIYALKKIGTKESLSVINMVEDVCDSYKSAEEADMYNREEAEDEAYGCANRCDGKFYKIKDILLKQAEMSFCDNS